MLQVKIKSTTEVEEEEKKINRSKSKYNRVASCTGKLKQRSKRKNNRSASCRDRPSIVKDATAFEVLEVAAKTVSKKRANINSQGNTITEVLKVESQRN